MLRRLAGCAVIVVTLAIIVVGVGVWLLRVPKTPAPLLRGEVRSASITVGGRQRTFTYYVPSRVREHPPLLLVLHGSMMDGKRMRAQTAHAFDEIADRDGFLVAYPDGYGGYWNDCRAAGDFEAKRLAIDDVAFLRALTDWFEREHKISEVFATGVSNGAQMAYRIALEAPDLIGGIAAVAANLPADGNQKCAPSGRPVATMIINGTEDPLNPDDGGEVALFGMFLRRGKVQSTLATATYWANLVGHKKAASVQRMRDNNPGDGTTATRHVWSGPGKPSVVLLHVGGGGHNLPHPKVRSPRLLGRTNHDFSGAGEIWNFFAAESGRGLAGSAEVR